MKSEPPKPVVKCEKKARVGRQDIPEKLQQQLTASEMENVTTVFRYFETGLREATILPKVGVWWMLIWWFLTSF